MSRVDEIYEDLKLRDRISPGRTPWQTLRRRAEATAAAEVFNARGLALTRAQKTEILAASFADTDRLLDTLNLTDEQRQELATARGWILEVLEERGDLAAVGLTADYEVAS